MGSVVSGVASHFLRIQNRPMKKVLMHTTLSIEKKYIDKDTSRKMEFLCARTAMAV
jgi:hypothetical protein